LEQRLGLVLTLFKASVYAYLSQEEARAEEKAELESRKGKAAGRK